MKFFKGTYKQVELFMSTNYQWRYLKFTSSVMFWMFPNNGNVDRPVPELRALSP